MDDYDIHKSLEGTYKETSSCTTTSKKFTVNARMSIRPPEGWTRKIPTDPDVVPRAHLVNIDECIRRLEVYVNDSHIHHDLLHECLKQLEKKIT